MTQPHDFKIAWHAFTLFDKEGDCVCDIPQDVKDTIRFALRLADKVCGEPSEGMMNAGLNEWSNLRDMYKAMLQQAIKEVQS